MELTDGRVGTEETMAAKGMAGDHEGVAGDHEAGLSHARWTRTKRARVPESDFNALRGLPWRIPLSAAADANQGGDATLSPRENHESVRSAFSGQ